MTIEQIEFETKEQFMIAIQKMLNKEEAYRTIADKDNKPIKKKIISNGNLYLGGNFSIRVNIGNNNKVYCGIEYFGVSERISFHKNKNKTSDEL